MWPTSFLCGTLSLGPQQFTRATSKTADSTLSVTNHTILLSHSFSKDRDQSGKVYKAISKALGLHWTTVRTIGTVANIPRSGWPAKIPPKAQGRLIQEVTHDSRRASNDLQASNIAVFMTQQEEKDWAKKRFISEQQGGNHCQPRETKHLDDPAVFWDKDIWVKSEMFNDTGPIMSGVKQKQHFTVWTLYQKSNMVMLVRCFVGALLSEPR